MLFSIFNILNYCNVLELQILAKRKEADNNKLQIHIRTYLTSILVTCKGVEKEPYCWVCHYSLDLHTIYLCCKTVTS